MCGINGIFAYHYVANPVDPAELTRTKLGAIVDDAGAQPKPPRPHHTGHRERLRERHRPIAVAQLRARARCQQPRQIVVGRVVFRIQPTDTLKGDTPVRH